MRHRRLLWVQQLGTSEVKVEVVHRGVGAITESDILFARAAGAIIVGFHVRPDNNARAAAEREGVEIKLYKIIYEAVEDIRSALEGMLRPEEKEVILGEKTGNKIAKLEPVSTLTLRYEADVDAEFRLEALRLIVRSQRRDQSHRPRSGDPRRHGDL